MAQLADVQKRYAPDHPDVIRLQKQVDTLRNLLASAPGSSAPISHDHPDNPAYIQIKAQRDAAESN